MIINKIIKNKLPLKEYCGNFVGEEYITVALGLFPEQNKLVETLINICYDMFRFGINEKKVNFKVGDFIKGVNLKLEVMPEMSFLKSTKAEFWGVKDDYLCISVIISRFDKNSLTKEQLLYKIASCITHELNHGYVFLSKFYNNNIIEEVPTYYHACLKIYNDDSIDDNIRDLCYILYSTYNFEIQAMVPQVYQELRGYFEMTQEEFNIDNFKKALKKTNTYWTYYSGLNFDIPKIETYLSDNNNLNYVLKIFKEFNLQMSSKELLNKIKSAKDIYTNTLKDISRCAMAYYFEKTENYGK